MSRLRRPHAALAGRLRCSDEHQGSKPLADGASTKVRVEVVTKPGLDVNIIGTLEVNGGLYTTPMKEIGPETDLPLGTYDGLVSRARDELTLEVEGQTIQLSGPESCD